MRLNLRRTQRLVIATVVAVTAWVGLTHAGPADTDAVLEGRVEEVQYCQSDGTTLADISLRLVVTNSGLEPLLIDRSGFLPLMWYVARSEADALAERWVSGIEVHDLQWDPSTKSVAKGDLLTIAPGRQVTLGSRAVTLYLRLPGTEEDGLLPGVYSLLIKFRASTVADALAERGRGQDGSTAKMLNGVLTSELIQIELAPPALIVSCDSIERENGPRKLRTLDRDAAELP